VSGNVIQLLVAGEATGRPTVLDELKAIVAGGRDLTDDDLRAVAARCGVPEATVHGVVSFYEDFTHPRGTRHVAVCTGTACWAADGGAALGEAAQALGVEPGRRTADGALSLAPTVCLGLCHAGPAVREGAVVDAGPGALARLVAGTSTTGPAPHTAVAPPLPPDGVLLRPGAWAGLRRALAHEPAALLQAVRDADVKGRGGAAFPAGVKWGFVAGTTPADGQRVVVVNGDEGDPGSYIDKHLMERNPALLLEGMALAAYAVGAQRGFVFVRSEYPDALPVLQAAVADACSDGYLGTDILGSGFSFDVAVHEGAGSYVVGEETALLASLQGLRGTVSARPPFPAERGWHGRPTLVNNVETLCNVPYVAEHGAEAYRQLSPGATPGTKLVCLNERFASPGLFEVPFGTSLRTICEELGGGLRDGGAIKALQIGGPLGGILPGTLLDTPLDFAPLAEHGCMVGHGSIVAFDERTDMRALARHLMKFGADESCGKCFPCRVGLRRGEELMDREGPIDRAQLEALLETLELGSLCAHGGGMPAPIRSLIAHFPAELGLV
jgi:NADH:ubiquinone oxidoreductase subunit F (NADH-binding)/NADH:ubiquinone oxidoreductase subunit E